MRRHGVETLEEAVELAHALARMPGLIFKRVMAYARPRGRERGTVAAFRLRRKSRRGVWRLRTRVVRPVRRPPVRAASGAGASVDLTSESRRALPSRKARYAARRGRRHLRGGERVPLDLADALAREPELRSDRLERRGFAVEAEAQLEQAPLALRERCHRAPHSLAPHGVDGLLGGIACQRVGEELADLAVAVGADALVERERRVRRRRAPRLRAAATAARPPPAPPASAARPSRASNSRRAGVSFTRRSFTCVGTRIVADWLESARWQAWRIHQVAYVENL